MRLLEHARFRLADPQKQSGAGQGGAQAGDTLRPADAGDEGGSAEGEGGHDDGGFKLLLELKVDDIVDWLTEELELPDLRPKSGATLEDEEIVREGTGKRGIRARLDRRRTVKEAVKRRAIQTDPTPFTDDDLRFHQLRQRPRMASNAVVVFALDVSASMTAVERKLAKTFFFFALSGLRRQYHRVEVRFVAHTTEAWEFPEREFFEVTGSGGTMASCAFELVQSILDANYEPSQYNAYVFYASDGENATDDRQAAGASLRKLVRAAELHRLRRDAPGHRALRADRHAQHRERADRQRRARRLPGRLRGEGHLAGDPPVLRAPGAERRADETCAFEEPVALRSLLRCSFRRSPPGRPKATARIDPMKNVQRKPFFIH